MRRSEVISFMYSAVFVAIIALFVTVEGEAEEEQCVKDSENCGSGKSGKWLIEASDGVLKNDVLVFTVASDPDNDYFKLYINSAQQYGINPQVLGLGKPWKGGLMTEPGGGVKINLLKQALEPYKEEEDKIVLFTDSYDVLFTGDLSEIVKKFKATGARVLFAAEAFCWPDVTVKDKYPPVKDGKRFLNSGIYMGYLPEIWEVLNVEPIKDNGDDQGYFTRIFLNEALRNKLKIKLDSKSEVFMCLNGAVHWDWNVTLFVEELEMEEDKSKESRERFKAKNVVHNTHPLVLHGNGPLETKLALGRLGNYLANAWSPVEGCIWCKSGHIDLAGKASNEMPLVYLAVFVEIPTPFLEEHLEKIYRQDYPKDRIHIFIHNNVKYHSSLVKEFVVKHGSEYLSVKQVLPEDSITEWNARDLSLDQCLAKECDIYFSVDSIAHLDNPHTLRLLIEQNRTVVAPMLVRPEKAWSNFWGALTKNGYYARSNDYMDIVHNEKRGLWIVPFISNSYLINATLLRKYDRKRLGFTKGDLDADMAFCASLRELGVFMFVSNRLDFGHLITPDSFDVTRTEPEMYQIFDNEQDWEQRYIHPDYPENLNPDKKPAQPCPDVYWFPIVTRKFTNALINMMEAFGKWSDGSNSDKRLEGGYEAVPTRDIHMNQVGWEPHWLQFLQRYVRPLQEHVFTGYFHDPPRSLMNFVVRYRPDEQPSLRPHHDSSTYTINVALNEVGTDYKGGGCRFIRYNCSVVDTKPGWLLMHPGRLTHYHEGLRVTEGTRYIMISFVDP